MWIHPQKIRQKLGMIVENKVVQKLKFLEENDFHNKLIFLNDFLFEKISSIFDIENWLESTMLALFDEP